MKCMNVSIFLGPMLYIFRIPHFFSNSRKAESGVNIMLNCSNLEPLTEATDQPKMADFQDGGAHFEKVPERLYLAYVAKRFLSIFF